jgi:hypothetical protein
MPADDRGRPLGAARTKDDLSRDHASEDDLTWLAEYPEWVRAGVRRWNRMRAAGVKWEIRPIVYPKPGPWGE